MDAKSAIIAAQHAQIGKLKQQLEQAMTRIDELLPDAQRYHYIRDRQYWIRREADEFDPAFALIGVQFDYDDNFSSKPMLDHHIDKRLKGERQ